MKKYPRLAFLASYAVFFIAGNSIGKYFLSNKYQKPESDKTEIEKTENIENIIKRELPKIKIEIIEKEEIPSISKKFEKHEEKPEDEYMSFPSTCGQYTLTFPVKNIGKIFYERNP